MKKALILVFLFCYTSVGISNSQNSTEKLPDKSQAKPNVILVITDDQGYGDIASHGNTMIKTPNLDELSAQSVRFTNFHVSNLCAPTRGALMTGTYPLKNGAWITTWGETMPRKEYVFLPAIFADNGYRTGIFGKWHLGENYPFRPQDRGFEEVLIHNGGGVGQTPDYWGNDYFDDTYFRNGVPEKHTGYCTDVWFSEAEKFIIENKDHPFFLYLSTNAPHGPLLVSPKYSDPYVAKGVPAEMAKFYGMIENIDENMGRLMANLEKWGLADNTILIFMTDNGTAYGYIESEDPNVWHGYNAGMQGTKASDFDGGHRVPFFLRWPDQGLQGGRDIKTLSAHVDVFPTLIDLCDLEAPANTSFDGISLGPILRGKSKPADRTLFIQRGPPRKWGGAIATQRWRLIAGKDLYEIAKDPAQMNNVAAQFPEVVQKLRAQYETWWDRLQPTFDEPSRIILGAGAENPSHLTAQDWHNEKYVLTPWNQSHIRQGDRKNGFWTVQVAKAGQYEIGLRRWPKELNQPILAALPGCEVIPATKVRLKIAEFDETQPITSNTIASKFKVSLPTGPTTLRTWLIDANEEPLCGAYYVEVKRVK